MEAADHPEKSLTQDDNNQNNVPAKCDKRGQWTNKREFILTVMGQIIGLGNVWRFPYLCFKNGGGAFLVPYVLFMITCGIPLFFLELSLGQLTGQGGITCWRKICPLFEGLGYGNQVVMFYDGCYYIIIFAWAFLYLFSSFHTVLPWANCNNTWNTENCIDYRQNDSVHGQITENATSSVEEFWRRRALGLSGGIEEMGSIRWDLAGYLLLSWIICYFCLWNGIKTSGKVVYFTAIFPYVMLIVLLIRGLTLPGAVDGIRFYLFPNPTRLSDPQVRCEVFAHQVHHFHLTSICHDCKTFIDEQIVTGTIILRQLIKCCVHCRTHKSATRERNTADTAEVYSSQQVAIYKSNDLLEIFHNKEKVILAYPEMHNSNDEAYQPYS